MEDHEQFANRVRLGLGRYGIAVDDTDLAVIGAAEHTYGAEIDALLLADLSEIEPERGFDAGRAPAPQEGPV